jgi:hypothetical protein
MTDIDLKLDLNLDSTPIITWLAQARKQGHLDLPALRRSLIARMIWKVSYQRSTGLIENVAYLIGRRIWGENPRATLATDIWLLRCALADQGHRLTYSRQPGRKGFYIRGRPPLDPKLEKLMVGAMAEIDATQMRMTHQLSAAQRFAQMISMIEFAEQAGAYRLQQKYPHLHESEARKMVRQGKVALP